MKSVLFRSAATAIILSLCLCGSSRAGGGISVGNGGNVVKCPARGALDDPQTQLEVLDIYEGRSLFWLTFPRLQGEPGYGKYLNHVLDALERDAPGFARRFRELWESFFSETHLGAGVQLRMLDDAYYVQLPGGCQLLQIAIQRTPLLPGDARYFIDADLFARLDELNQAALILHEILYREALEAGQTNSLATRRLVGILLGDELDKLTPTQFQGVLRELGFASASKHE